MKSFSKAYIDSVREYFRGQDYSEIEVTLGERSFSYFVVPQEEEPDLLDFVVRITGNNPSDGHVFGISDHVKEHHRSYAVAHEFIEFTEIGVDVEGRCVRALEEELTLVPKDIKPDYLRMRRDFFRGLIPYCEEQPENYNDQDIAEFRKTLAHLEELLN